MGNSHDKHHYPQYKKGDNYELFKTKLNYWAKITSLAKEKQGLAIALYSLPENDESMIYEKVMREIPQADLEKETGLDTLIKFLDKHLGKDSMEEAWGHFLDFEVCKRGDLSIAKYIADFDEKYKRMEKSAGGTVAPFILAFKLLYCANLTNDELLVTMTGLDFSKKDQLYEDAKTALKKYKGGIVSGGGCSGAGDQAIRVKVEEAYIAGFGAGRGYRGGYRGQSGGRGGGGGRQVAVVQAHPVATRRLQLLAQDLVDKHGVVRAVGDKGVEDVAAAGGAVCRGLAVGRLGRVQPGVEYS